jgi:hypothetical protein
MKLNLDIGGEVGSLDLEGDDLADMILQAIDHVEQHFPHSSARKDLSALLIDVVLDGLASDLAEIDLHLN